jgi:hypothetical protein
MDLRRQPEPIFTIIRSGLLSGRTFRLYGMAREESMDH